MFATGGMALALTAVGAAAGGTQAVISVDDYAKKQALRAARTGDKKHDLIEQGDGRRRGREGDHRHGVRVHRPGRARPRRSSAAGAVDDVAAKVGRLGELAGAEKEGAFKTALDVMGPPKALDAVGGLDAARGQLGAGSAALKRAEAYSDELVEEMGQSLGGKQAREQAAKQIGPDALPDRPRAEPGRRRPRPMSSLPRICSSRRRTSPRPRPACRPSARSRPSRPPRTPSTRSRW